MTTTQTVVCVFGVLQPVQRQLPLKYGVVAVVVQADAAASKDSLADLVRMQEKQ
jgi:hypothetical protein